MRVLDMAIASKIEVAISPPLLTEVMRVLRDKFGWAENELTDAQALIRSITKSVTPTQTLDVVKADPSVLGSISISPAGDGPVVAI